MSFISYSQNYEDLMLWRALKDVKKGFYIDVGANHPRIDSVTKHFYDLGWSGVNIEPEYELYELLESERSRDINLNIAISSKQKEISFYVSDIRGWSTTDENSAKKLEEQEVFNKKVTVQAKTIDSICQKYNINEIHFLKIDVEGAEKDVLQSISFSRIRPWIVVVEATQPDTQLDVSSNWEYILLENSYEYAYFDGLNKFYVSNEKEYLINTFKIPPNPFDNAILDRYNGIEEKLDEAVTNAHHWYTSSQELEKINSELEKINSELELNVSILQHQYQSIINSRSWKITKPIRLVSKKSKNILRKVYVYILSKPKLKNKIVFILKQFPSIYERLRNSENVNIQQNNSSIQNYQDIQSKMEIDNLSQEAKNIYEELNLAIKKKDNM